MIDAVVDFFYEHGDGLFKEHQRDQLHDALIMHIAYGTIKVWADEKGVVAAARWNWCSKNQVEVLDFAIRKDMRKKGLVKPFTRACLDDLPSCVGIFFQDKAMKHRYYKRREYFYTERGETNEVRTEK